MNRSTRHIGIMDIVLLLVSLVFLLGMLFWFDPCGPNADGSWMNCHWAGNAVTGLACVLVAVCAARLCIQNSFIKMGLSLAIIPVSALACLVPNNVIHLCMMRSMRCHTVMTPAVFVCGALMIAAAVIDICMRRERGKS